MLADSALDVTVRCYCVRASCPARPRPPCWLVRLLKGRSIPAADAVLALRARGILSVRADLYSTTSTHVSNPQHDMRRGSGGRGRRRRRVPNTVVHVFMIHPVAQQCGARLLARTLRAGCSRPTGTGTGRRSVHNRGTVAFLREGRFISSTHRTGWHQIRCLLGGIDGHSASDATQRSIGDVHVQACVALWDPQASISC
jgi:hypothetical protein